MPDPSGLLLILLPLAAASGWFVARMRPAEEQEPCLDPRLTEGLGLLVNNQTDAAIDLFMNIAEAEPETAELQLTLGNLFRRRGEIDRALRVHHQLSQNLSLPPLQRNRARPLSWPAIICGRVFSIALKACSRSSQIKVSF